MMSSDYRIHWYGAASEPVSEHSIMHWASVSSSVWWLTWPDRHFQWSSSVNHSHLQCTRRTERFGTELYARSYVTAQTTHESRIHFAEKLVVLCRQLVLFTRGTELLNCLKPSSNISLTQGRIHYMTSTKNDVGLDPSGAARHENTQCMK